MPYISRPRDRRLGDRVRQKATMLIGGTGTGLVGSAIKHVITTEPLNSRFGRKEDEEWIFLGSVDCDLRSVLLFVPFHPRLLIVNLGLGTLKRRNDCSRSIDRLM